MAPNCAAVIESCQKAPCLWGVHSRAAAADLAKETIIQAKTPAQAAVKISASARQKAIKAAARFADRLEWLLGNGFEPST